jgi:hypothetical protein
MNSSSSFKKALKAYWVGSQDDLRSIGMPWCDAEIVLVNENEGSNKARSYHKYSDVPYLHRKARRCPENDLYEFEGGRYTIRWIERVLKLRKWRADMEKMVTDMPEAKVYIYSGQWGMYWCSNYSGYTYNKSTAGIYNIKDAWNAVSHCGIEKQIDFEIAK